MQFCCLFPGRLKGALISSAMWPLLLTSTTAIILVMSSLYQALQSVLHELQEREEKARNAGYCDPLINPGNRNLLDDRLQQAMNNLRRSAGP
jgi:hypothetical protein